MPIYEFKCLKCEEFIEILVVNSKDEAEMKCPKCNSKELERVLSATSYNVGVGGSTGGGACSKTRTCSSGNCTTYEIPGPTR